MGQEQLDSLYKDHLLSLLKMGLPEKIESEHVNLVTEECFEGVKRLYASRIEANVGGKNA